MADIGHIASRRTTAHRRLLAAVARLAAMAKIDPPKAVTGNDSAHDAQFGQMLELERMADFLDRLSGELGVGPEPAPKPELPAPPAPRVETLTERRQREYAEDMSREAEEQDGVATANWPAAAKPQPNPPTPSKQIPAAPDLDALGTEGASAKTPIPPEPEQQEPPKE